jgi:RNA:NAD 2'-phosphotransferase (TPT1/KptA family)
MGRGGEGGGRKRGGGERKKENRKEKKKKKPSTSSSTENAKTSQVLSSVLRNYANGQSTNVKLPYDDTEMSKHVGEYII